ncbi:hypothetical protein SYJ56_24610 [Algoriphagus sp. D3-2-R+10]|uniref:hypothetical protein n=1 Tax=Algoriphagus aurantiacus TaxID=3103948 RepID=UPI002B3F1A51|nr:hypothetical protein [Algoriphagus sp. D3-2-R+10]MEB2778514.1 hypothetical protein [Algoriphagus sp. D3-2-R+10]
MTGNNFKKLFVLILSIYLHQSFSLYAQENTTEWFPLVNSTNDPTGPSVIGMRDWLDKPAGKHGFVRMKDSGFEFEDGTPVKFWGVNISSERIFSDSETSDQYVSYLSKYGINSVRFHKFTWHAAKGDSSTVIRGDLYDKMDYFLAALKENGIYYGWSHIYGHKLGPADKSRVLAYEEIVNTKFPWSHLNGTTASIVNFAPDLQALNIELTVNMLNHVNPKTGLKYAEDPALTFIELQNEDNIYWGAMEETLKQTPSYHRLLCQQFSEWLSDKYGSTETLRLEWGNDNLPANESLEEGTVYPVPNHSQFDAIYFNAENNGKELPQHYLDKAEFLFTKQMEFYNRFVEAIRNTGYKGTIVGSCWQAGSGLTHFYNLYADYKTGFIDRHNYFGGGVGGHRMQTGEYKSESMLTKPGSGLLGTGFQQVLDRPFAFSEWMSLIPNEYTVEASPLIAVYGMGLQGWDASYAFGSDHPYFTETIQSPGGGVYNPDVPSQIGLYPALARMIYRGDITESPVVHTRNVSLEQLRSGNLDFSEQIIQDHDVKSFKSDLPLEALAYGRVVVDFTENAMETIPFDTGKIEGNEIVSETGELNWNTSGKGFFKVNTAATVGLVGFLEQDSTYNYDLLDIETENSFAVIFITSLDRRLGIKESKSVLITTLARSRNTGMIYDDGNKELVSLGRAPILLEPVELTLNFKARRNAKIYILNHEGIRTGESIEMNQGYAKLSGKLHHTFYYELVWEQENL